ncbi:MAG TPA: phosphatase PAP2 family protein, partial [Chloroflexota bacterium]
MIDSLGALAHQIESGDIVLAAALLLLVTAGLCVPLAVHRSPGFRSRANTYRRFAWQLGALLGLEQAYEFTRGRIAPSPDIAILNSYRLLDLEWRHGLFVEQRLERYFLQFGALMNAIDVFYVFGHLLITVGALIWIYVWRRNHYPFVRNLIMLTTTIALVSFYLFPTAPPRMLGNYGFVDP